MTNKPRLWTLLSSTGVLLLFVASLAFGGVAQKDKGANLQKTDENDLYKPFLINNVFNYYSNNGDGSFNKFSTDNEGFEFYKGSGKHIIFEDGVVWGGFHKGASTAKVGGSVYRHGLQAGPIITNGTATTDPVGDDASRPANRIYRVRPDMNPNTTTFDQVQAKLESDEVSLISRYESISASDLYAQYTKDWNEWPAAQGAPFTYGIQINGADTIRRAAPLAYNPLYDIPGVKGSDQTLWYVANDCNAARTANLAGSPVIGLEMQRTIWGYKRAGALGNTIFASTILINKSGAPVDSMFLVQWADPDLGYATDDFAASDSARSLGYVYNGSQNDAVYGTACPAGGFDFFQGPIVASPNDSAVFKLHYKKGFKNLPMSTFVFFVNCQGCTFADPAQGGGGDIQWYRLMNGLIASSGAPFVNPVTGLNSKFTVNGDPVTGTGWTMDKSGLSPQDIRICMVTGPFRMADRDTQELVVANVAGLGSDRLSSITALRAVDDKAQQAYNNLFVLPGPPPAPVVTATPLNNEVVLSWGDPAGIAKTEGTVDQGYTFEGYNVWEYRSTSDNAPIKLGTFDLTDGVTVVADTVYDASTGLNMPTVLQLGSDNGVIRSMRITSSKVSGTALINGSKYYFGVTAYSYNANPPAAAGTHSLESPNSPVTVIPQGSKPGVRYAGKPGDTLAVAQTGAPSDGSVTPIVVDPSKTTGHQYKVSFKVDADGNTLWDLTDVTAGKAVLSNQTNQAGDNNYAIVDGLEVIVAGPPPGMKTYATAANGQRDITFAGSDATGSLAAYLEGYSNTIGMGYNYPFIATSVTPDKLKNVKLKFAAADGTWDPKTKPADPNFSRGYRYLRAAGPAAKPEFAPWIINTAPNYGFQDYNYSVPFAAYDEESTPERRLMVGFLENNVSGGLVDGKYWPPSNTDAAPDNAGTGSPREWFFIYDLNYSETPDPGLGTAGTSTMSSTSLTVPLMWWGICDRRSVDPNTAGNFRAGTEFTIVANHVNTPASSFTFTAPSVTTDPSLAKADVQNINVFPNPYLGFNAQEINRYARFVTFTHLPTKATIRVFNLAGVLIRTLMKNDPTQFTQWDLNNENGFPVSAGMYVVYIDMPDLGTTKTLKLGVIPEQQYLDRWGLPQ